MSIQGDLSKFKLADILQMVAMGGQEGTLIVSDAESKKWLYFSKDGISLLSSGKRQPTTLGQRLLAMGKLTKAQLEDALLEYRKTGKRLGEVLIERNLVSKEDVEEAVRAQIADEIFDLLEWEGATFEFVPGPPMDNVATHSIGRHVTFDVNSILLEAARRADEWEVVKSKIRSLNEVLVPAVMYRSQLDLSGELSAAFSLVDGRSTIREIIQKLQMPRLEAANLLAMLVELGAVRFATQEELIRLAQSVGMSENPKMQAELYELALQRKEDPVIRQRWSEVLERDGKKDVAAAQYKQLAEARLQAGDLQGGADFLRQVVRLAPHDKESRLQLIDVLLQLKSPAQASVQIRRLAQIYTEEGQVPQAIEEYRRLLKVMPRDYEAQKQLVDLLIQQDRVEEAFHETETLEGYAKTPAEREQVFNLYGRLVAARPNFAPARRKLELLAQQQQRRAKVARLSRRAVLIGSVILLVLGAVAAYEWLAQMRYRDAWAESRALAQKGDYQAAIALLRESLGSFTYSRAYRKTEEMIRDLSEAQKRAEEEHKNKIQEMKKAAAEKEEMGDLKGAAEALLWLADQSNFLTGFPLRQKAGELMEFWNRADRMLKHAQELCEKPEGVQEAHAEIRRLYKLFPKPAAFMGAKLPVRVVSNPPGASVTADGKPLGTTPLVVYKTPGQPLTLTLVSPEGESITNTIESDNEWQVIIALGEQKKQGAGQAPQQ